MATQRCAALGERTASTPPPEPPSCSARISKPHPPLSKTVTCSRSLSSSGSSSTIPCTIPCSTAATSKFRETPSPVGCVPPPVSYTHLRAHETDSYLVCRLLLEK